MGSGEDTPVDPQKYEIVSIRHSNRSSVAKEKNMAKIEMLFSGDVVLADEYDDLVSDELKCEIMSCDLACCNFEAPVKTDHQQQMDKIGPNLSQNVATVHSIKAAGYDLVTLANNHSMDYGIDGLATTIEALNSAGIAHIGAGIEAANVYEPHIIEKQGMKIGIISVAENGFGAALSANDSGYAWFESDCFYKCLDDTLKECSMTIIVCHAGLEDMDLPLPEIRALYRSWIDKGVCAVIAHHPHVPQGWEEYQKGVIFYSLGNFAFHFGTEVYAPDAISVKLTVTDEGIVNYEVIKTRFVGGRVSINHDIEFDNYLDACNQKLRSMEYVDFADRMCIEMFDQVYKNYYVAAASANNGVIKNMLRSLYCRLFKRENFSQIWLYHNLVIETHYWTCRRALLSRFSKF